MLASTCSMRLATLATAEVLVAIVDRLELAPVDRNDSPREKVELTAQHDDLRARRADRRPAVAAEVEAIVLKSGISRPVSHINSMLRWLSRSSRRLDWMRPKIAVEVDLQKRRRMIGEADRSPPAQHQKSPALPGPVRQ